MMEKEGLKPINLTREEVKSITVLCSENDIVISINGDTGYVFDIQSLLSLTKLVKKAIEERKKNTTHAH